MFQPELETMAPERRADLQGERLRAQVERLRTVPGPYWRDKLDGVGTVGSVADLQTLPFTVKSELRDTYPFGMLAVPLASTVRVHASSGTRGKPTVVAYTRRDIEIFAETNARAIASAGGTADDVIQVAYGYGLFTGGLGLHYGVEALGATTVPASGGNPSLQLQLFADLGVAGLCCTPSFALLLAERAAAEGVSGIGLRFGVCGAEPWSDAFRGKLEEAWSAVTGQPFDACDIYGLSEVMGPGVAMESRECKGGLHIFSDHYLPEIIDPGTGEPVAQGELGELVLTTLTKEAFPVLRYRTGDLTRFLVGDCHCGRTFPRMARLTGRVDDMLVIRGINVFPSEIEAIVLAEEGLSGQYAIVVDRRSTLPELQVHCELAGRGTPEDQAAVADRLAERLLTRLRVRVAVEVGPQGSVPRQEVGKAVRVFERTAESDPFGGG